MKVDGSLRSLLQGVSQQPPRDRLPGQCTDQLNMSSNPVTGLSRRPPSDLVGNLFTSSNVRGWHNFETRNGSKFLMAVVDGSIKVFDYNAVLKTTNFTSGLPYLSLAGNFKFGTIEDETIIVNNAVVPAMTSAVKSYYNAGTGSKPAGIIQVLGGAYAREYVIKMDGVQIAKYKPPDGSTAVMADFVRTTHIATRLSQAMTGTAGTTTPDGASSLLVTSGLLSNATNWTVTVVSDIILIQRNVGPAFGLAGSDDTGSINMKVMTDTTSDTSDLPALAPHGYLARIAKETDPQKDLFVQFFIDGSTPSTPLGSGFGTIGYWQEVTASGTPYIIDKATMPTSIKYDQSTGQFTYALGAWADRQVGTIVSNPDPSFIGNPIQDVTSFQSRLVFLAGSNVIMSRTKKRLDFWNQSTAANSDSDPIDISSTAVEASIMLSAVPHNRDLIVFSKQGQFVVFGRTALTPTNAALVLTTAFEADLNAKPVPAGRNVFFATSFGQYTGIREFYAEGNSDINDSRPITEHVNKFLKGSVRRISATSNYNTAIVQTDADVTTIYPYQYIWSDTTKVQSSWSRWQFRDEVVYSFFDEELIYFVMKTGTQYYLLRMSLDVQFSGDLPYTIHLDSRFDVTGVNTQFVLPVDHMGDDPIRIVQSTGCPNPGLPAPILSKVFSPGVGWVITLKYDMQGGAVVGGVEYTSSYKPTMPYVKDQDGVVIGTAKLRVKEFLVTLKDTGYIAGKVITPYGDSEPEEFGARIIGDVSDVIGSPALTNDVFSLPVREEVKSSEVVFYTDSYLPMTLLDVEWIGQFNKRGKRISTGGSK